ncbi:MAG: 50S ribosomal protein L4 [Bacilli bacterium]|nr:50S ribosomal protein L4 [Bacilli bacterium]
MPKVALLNLKGEKVKDIKLNDEVFGIEPNNQTIYDAVVRKGASLRQGTHAVKDRSEVSGGGAKPWRQKGSGRARQGSIRSPQWYHGGIVFGPTTERNYEKKQNRKESRLALRSALSYKASNKSIMVLEKFDVKDNKTKTFIKMLSDLKIEGKVLVVVKELTDNLILASRNLSDVKVIESHEINTYDVLNYKTIVITEEAVKMLEEVLK